MTDAVAFRCQEHREHTSTASNYWEAPIPPSANFVLTLISVFGRDFCFSIDPFSCFYYSYYFSQGKKERQWTIENEFHLFNHLARESIQLCSSSTTRDIFHPFPNIIWHEIFQLLVSPFVFFLKYIYISTSIYLLLYANV